MRNLKTPDEYNADWGLYMPEKTTSNNAPYKSQMQDSLATCGAIYLAIFVVLAYVMGTFRVFALIVTVVVPLAVTAWSVRKHPPQNAKESVKIAAISVGKSILVMIGITILGIIFIVWYTDGLGNWYY